MGGGGPNLGDVQFPKLALHRPDGHVGQGQDEQADQAGDGADDAHDPAEAPEAEQAAHGLHAATQ